jgi:uncharacterized membrane protein YgdD (TMEM256/DUF423 family)
MWVATGAALACLAVALGAFGAHGLRTRVTPELLSVFETGVRYQMYHALALLAVGWQVDRTGSSLAAAAGGLFLAGIVLFSGSLYAMTFTGARWLGAVTPIGGVCFIAGWALLAAAALRTG